METAHLTSLGARPIPRRDFLALLDRLAVTDDRAGRWPADGVLDAFKRAGLTKERGAERRSD